MDQPELLDDQRAAMLAAIEGGTPVKVARELAGIGRDTYHAYMVRGRAELADEADTPAAEFAQVVMQASGMQSMIEDNARDAAAAQRYLAIRAGARTVELSKALTTY